MIYGIGTDIVNISRIEKLYSKYGDKFLSRVFSEEEIKNIPKENYRSYLAGRFAVKESMVKATGNRDIDFTEISVLNDATGKPFIPISDHLKQIVKVDNFKILVTISHEKDYAIAFVIIEKTIKEKIDIL